MSNLIDRDEAIASIEYLERKCDIKQWNGAGYMKQILADAKQRILSIPLQQQGGNEKIKEIIERRIAEKPEYINEKRDELEELLSEIDNLPPNN